MPKSGDPINAVLRKAVDSHNELELTDSQRKADYIFLVSYFPFKIDIEFPKKTLIVDYNDGTNLFKKTYEKVLLYFKRSVCDKHPSRFRNYGNRNIIPISYPIKDEAAKFKIKPLSERGVDIAVFFPFYARGNRGKISKIIRDNYGEKYNIHIGYLGKNGHKGRSSVQKEYYDKILDSKIVVTANPAWCEGDWRLFEALGCATLTIVDKMITPVKNRLEDGKHLLYYESKNELIKKIDYYIKNLDEAQMIATSGHNHVLKHHTAKARIDEILEEIKNIERKQVNEN
jgi:spore maturation protein CgeB